MAEATSTTFREKVEVNEQTQAPRPVSTERGPQESSVEVPYLDYESANSKPFSVEYFNLGDLWDDPEGGFTDEVSTIEEYFAKKIETGELANSISAVKHELKEIEKLHDLKDEERMTVKIGTIASYIKFLNETDGIKFNSRKYANAK